MKFAPQESRTYLLTAVTAQRRRFFQVTTTAELFIATLQGNRAKGRFDLYAYVVMPDHFHLLLTPAADVSLEKVAQFVKGGFSFRLKSKMDVWERSYDNRRITDGEHFDSCKRYVEENPVRKGLVTIAEDYGYGSCGREQLVDPKPLWFGRAKARSFIGRKQGPEGVCVRTKISPIYWAFEKTRTLNIVVDHGKNGVLTQTLKAPSNPGNQAIRSPSGRVKSIAYKHA